MSAKQTAESPETAADCWTCRTRAATGQGPCSVHHTGRSVRLTVGETTYTARRVIDIAGADESADTYRLALDAAREAGIPDEARITAFMTSRAASFSFHWIVAEVQR